MKQRGEEDEARQAKFRESLSQLKAFLMEAMANHGDSLTVVKPSEYVNLVIVDEETAGSPMTPVIEPSERSYRFKNR